MTATADAAGRDLVISITPRGGPPAIAASARPAARDAPEPEASPEELPTKMAFEPGARFGPRCTRPLRRSAGSKNPLPTCPRARERRVASKTLRLSMRGWISAAAGPPLCRPPIDHFIFRRRANRYQLAATSTTTTTATMMASVPENLNPNRVMASTADSSTRMAPKWWPTSMKEPASGGYPPTQLLERSALVRAARLTPPQSSGPQDPAYTIGTPDPAPLGGGSWTIWRV